MGQHGEYRALVIARAIAIALGLLLAAPVQALCRQALALGLDVSGSVSRADHALQMNGLAQALEDRDVVGAFLAVPGAPVALSVYEWSGSTDQKILVSWTLVQTEADLRQVAATLRDAPRRRAQSGTAIGDAMGFGLALFAEVPECERRTLDISGDGRSNLGRALGPLRDLAVAQGVTVNGLVIAADMPLTSSAATTELERLRQYYLAEVVVGREAFVETATSFEDFSRAMRRKLLREISVPLSAQAGR